MQISIPVSFALNLVAVKIFFLPFVFFCHALNAQSIRNPASSIYTGMGAYSNDFVDVFSFQNNQAALAKLHYASAGVYAERKLLLKELSFYNAVVALLTHSGNFGLDARYSGFADYNEIQLGLAYARSLGKAADVGVQFNYYSVKIAGYGNASAINFEIGAIIHLSDKLNAGVHICNPAGAKLNKGEQEKLASVYSAGMGYNASGNFYVFAEIEKEENQPVNVKSGLQYKFLPQFMARAGISTATSAMYFGLGLTWRSFRLDIITNYHQPLGITPGLLLIFHFNKKEN
jgi:hypothetical protein